MELLAILGVLVGGLILALLYADMLALPLGEMFFWTQKKFGFPRDVKTGPEGLIGQRATVIRPFAWDEQRKCLLGKVRLNGEVWWAQMADEQAAQIRPGESVRVESVDGLVLLVRAVKKAG